MRFLLDVHIAASIGRSLTAQGHDVLSASVDHALWSDPELLALAVREARILVTEDRDFSDLIYGEGAAAPPSVIYLRGGPSLQLRLADRLMLVLANTKIDGHMVVIDSSSVRHRPLPETSNDNG